MCTDRTRAAAVDAPSVPGRLRPDFLHDSFDSPSRLNLSRGTEPKGASLSPSVGSDRYLGEELVRSAYSEFVVSIQAETSQ